MNGNQDSTTEEKEDVMERPLRPLQRVYIIRVWLEKSPHLPDPRWCIVLQEPHSEQRLGFTTLEAVVDYLKQQLSDSF